MRFLLDHDVYGSTARFLTDLGHEIVQVAHIGLAQDEDLLKVAQAQGRLFVTRDRDFGGLVFVNALGAGSCTCAYFPPPRMQFTESWNTS